MTKTLLKTGNSHSLVISKEMKAHLKIEDNRIEVEFHDGRIVLSKPATFEEAMEETLAQFGTALKNLGK